MKAVHAVWTACDEHVGDAIDDAVHAFEQSPDLYPVEACSPMGRLAICDYCEKASMYLIV